MSTMARHARQKRHVSQNGGGGFVSTGTISLTRSVAIGNAANNVYSNGGGVFFSFGNDVIGVGSVTLATPALRRSSGSADIVRRF
ncbi:hypothetical protein [Methylosinus sporium]|uniref:hypothetical protein n=1 Tax=Methylosinus sporium TaxID=428 RepID=UPI00383AE76A